MLVDVSFSFKICLRILVAVPKIALILFAELDFGTFSKLVNGTSGIAATQILKALNIHELVRLLLRWIHRQLHFQKRIKYFHQEKWIMLENLGSRDRYFDELFVRTTTSVMTRLWCIIPMITQVAVWISEHLAAFVILRNSPKDGHTPKKHMCHKEAICINLPGSHRCQCNDGWVGDGIQCEALRCPDGFYGKATECYPIQPERSRTVATVARSRSC